MIGILPGTVNQIRIIQHCLHSEIDFTGKLLFCTTSCYKCLLGEIKQLSNPFSCTGKAGGVEQAVVVWKVLGDRSVFVGEGHCVVPFPSSLVGGLILCFTHCS